MSGRLGFPTQLKKKKNSLVMDLEELYMSCRLGFLSQLQKRKYIPYVCIFLGQIANYTPKVWWCLDFTL